MCKRKNGKCQILSTHSWSFGVLLYELLTLGQEPYKDLKKEDEIVAYLNDGNRLPKPDMANEIMYANFLKIYIIVRTPLWQ